ncbi:MAG: hypothetical protein IJE77_02360, partial [Thermoguttaceae bacterium]|nr:hypothetical protein [Thermoguttaceae bacterium]
GAKSLGEGQKGLVFAAFMKLLIPFIVIFPGMIALNLFSADMKANADKASAKEMARFEEVKANPTTGATLFSFNRSFASIYPEKADEILAFNAAASGVNLDEAVAAAEKAGKINKGMKDEELRVAKLAAIQAKAPTAKTGAMLNGCDYDAAFPLLMAKVVPTGGFKGFMLAALLGAIVSSVAAMLNAASTIFSMDIYNEYLVNKNLDEAARQKKLVLVGRIAVVAFVLIGCVVAPMWANPKFGGVFKAIQEFQGYISPGIFAAFVVGFWMKKAPNSYGAIALIACPILYGALATFVPSLDFLNRMAVTFAVLIALAVVMSIVCPRKEAFVHATDESKAEFLKESKGAKIFGIVVVVLTVVLYLRYWDWDLTMF